MENIIFILKKYYKDFIMILLICISIALSCYNIFKENTQVVNDQNLMDEMDTIAEEEEEKETLTFQVDIKGEVQNPGVYKVQEGAIVNDVITLAGGMKNNAKTDNINLSKKVSDEMVIYIYNKNESKSKTTSVTTETCESPSYNISDCVEKSESIIISGNLPASNEVNNASSEETVNSELININTASKEQLDSLNGIGSTKAQAIIDYRNQNGKFSKIEDLLNVNGIGDSIFAKIKDYITV